MCSLVCLCSLAWGGFKLIGVRFTGPYIVLTACFRGFMDFGFRVPGLGV